MPLLICTLGLIKIQIDAKMDGNLPDITWYVKCPLKGFQKARLCVTCPLFVAIRDDKDQIKDSDRKEVIKKIKILKKCLGCEE